MGAIRRMQWTGRNRHSILLRVGSRFGGRVRLGWRWTRGWRVGRAAQDQRARGGGTDRSSRHRAEWHAVPLAVAPGRRGVHRRGRPGLLRAGRGGRHRPQRGAVHDDRIRRRRRRRRPELHLPEQHVDRHRQSSGGPRHLRQFLPRPGQRRGGCHDRPGAHPLADRHGRVLAPRRHGRVHHGQGQAAPAARQGHGSRRGKRQLLGGIRGAVHAGGDGHRERARAGRPAPAPHVLARAVPVRARGGNHAPGAAAA